MNPNIHRPNQRCRRTQFNLQRVALPPRGKVAQERTCMLQGSLIRKINLRVAFLGIAWTGPEWLAKAKVNIFLDSTDGWTKNLCFKSSCVAFESQWTSIIIEKNSSSFVADQWVVAGILKCLSFSRTFLAWKSFTETKTRWSTSRQPGTMNALITVIQRG